MRGGLEEWDMRSCIRFLALFTIIIAISFCLTGLFAGSVLSYPSGWSSDHLDFETSISSFDVAARGNTVYLTYTKDNKHVYFRRSNNGGLTWMSKVAVNDGANDSYTPKIAVVNSAVFVTWTGKSPSFSTYSGMFSAVSNNNGASFNFEGATPTTMPNGIGTNVRNISMDVGGNSQPIVVWENYPGSGSHSCFFTNVSTMATAGYSIIQVATPIGEGWDAVDCLTPVVGCNDGADYCMAYIARTLKAGSGTKDSVRITRFNEHTGFGRWGSSNPAPAVESTDYGTTGNLKNLDYQCVSGSDMRLVYDYKVSGATYRAKCVSTNTNSFSAPIVYADNVTSDASIPAACRGGEIRLLRGVSGGNNPCWISDTRNNRVVKNSAAITDFRAESDGAGGPSFIVWLDGDKTLSIKRTDTVAPTCDPICVNGQRPSTVPTYFKSSFPLSLSNVKDANWNVTGSDSQSLFNNGVTSVAFRYSKGGTKGPWMTLKTINATGSSGLSWKSGVTVPGFGDGVYYFKGTVTDTAGNSADSAVSGKIVVDTIAPKTTIGSGELNGDNGWYKTNTSIVLSPTDAGGLDCTKYRIKDDVKGTIGEWITYGGSFVLTEGRWTIDYYSADKAGNIENIRSSYVKIDTTAPDASVLRPEKDAVQTGFESTQTETVSGTGSDSGSGLASENILLNGKVMLKNSKTSSFNTPVSASWNVAHARAGVYCIQVTVRDRAGNVGTAEKRVALDEFCKDSYLAEGNTLPDFKEFLCLQNPGEQAARVHFDFMLEDGSIVPADVALAAHSRTTYDVKQFVPEGHSGVSTKVHCDNQAVVVERPMYFHYKSTDPGRNWKGGHIAPGIHTLQKTYYFAEGATFDDDTSGHFDEWLTVQNPNTQLANVAITYMLSDGSNISRAYQVAPHSRTTVSVNQDVGNGKEVSTRLASDVPVAVERPQYQNYHRGFAVDGHDAVGATSPLRSWHFAEGSTRDGFEEWITLQNPGDIPAHVKMTYMLSQTSNGKNGGGVVVANKTVPPRSRSTVKVSDDIGDNKDSSANVDSDQPIVAERPMYFDYNDTWDGASDAMGIPSTSRTFFIAEGCTQQNFDTYYCIENANATTATVDIKFMLGDGRTPSVRHTIAPHSRLTIKVNDEVGVGTGQDVSAKLTSSVPITVERPMYFNCDTCVGGHVGTAYGID